MEEVDNTKQFTAPWVKMLITHLHFSFLSPPFPGALTSACIHMLMYDKAETEKSHFSLRSRADVPFRESIVFQI